MRMYTVEPLLTTTPDARLPCLWRALTLVPTALLFRIVLKKPVSQPPLYSVLRPHFRSQIMPITIKWPHATASSTHFLIIWLPKKWYKSFHKNYPHIYISYNSPFERCSSTIVFSLSMYKLDPKNDTCMGFPIHSQHPDWHISSHLGKSFVWRSLQKGWHNRN